MEDINEISYLIRKAIYAVHNYLGPGLLESVYEAALVYELKKLGLKVSSQVPVPVNYKDIHLHLGFRLDIVVNDLVIVEIKSIDALLDVHKKQVLTYIKLTNKPLGLLVNFNSSSIIDNVSLFRIINSKNYKKISSA